MEKNKKSGKNKNVLDISEIESEIRNMRGKEKKRSLYKPDDGEYVSDIVYDAEKEIQELREEEKLEKEKKERDVKNNSFGVFNNMSVEEMESHYSHCIKLCSDNKVNTKNAFKLQLIDYMKLILAKKTVQTDNLPLMSCTLDASAKIYSCRVDKVYADMVGIISKRNNKEVDELEPGKKSKELTSEEKKKSKYRDESSDDERDRTEIEGDFETKWNKMLGSHESFDRGKIEQEHYYRPLPRNLEYFIELPLTGVFHQLSLEGPLIDLQDCPKEANILELPMFELTGERGFEGLGQLIPGYNNLWEKYSVEGSDDRPSLPKGVDSSYLYFPSAESSQNPQMMSLAEEEEDAVVEGESDREIGGNDEMDGGLDFDDLFPCEDNIEGAEEMKEKTVESKEPRRSKRLTVATMGSLVTSASSDYSFFDESKLAFWKKPDQWQLKRSRLGVKAQQKKSAKSKKPKGVSFKTDELQTQFKKLLDTNDRILTNKTVRDWCNKKQMIPLEILDIKTKITCCFKLEVLTVLKKGSVDENCDDIAVDLDTSMKFTPEDFLGNGEKNEDDDDDIHGDAVSHVDETMEGGVGWGSDDHLSEVGDAEHPTSSLANSVPPLDNDAAVNEMDISSIAVPYKVNKISIQFAKRQKRVDIRRVKEAMWDIIKESNKEVELTEIGPKRRQSTTTPLKFSELLSTLPNRLPEETNSEMSFATAFMSLLHLANEKNLDLTGSTNFDDALIKLESL